MDRPCVLAPWYRCRALLLVTSIGASIPVSLPSSASAAAPESSEAAPESPEVARPSFGELVGRAETHRAAGEHAEAARAFVAAYDALVEDEQLGLKGELMVSNAVDDFRLAQELDPQGLSLLEEEAALLGRHGRRDGGLPLELANELERVEARIDELRGAEAVGTEASGGASQAEMQPTAQVPPVEAVEAVEAVEERQDTDGLEPVGPRPRRATTVILGSGVVGLATGASLLAVGVRTFGAADDRRDQQLAALNANEYPDEAEIRERLDQWHQRARSIATGLTVGGAVAMGVGVALTSWGAARRLGERRASKRRATLVSPMVSRNRLGIAATVRF